MGLPLRLPLELPRPGFVASLLDELEPGRPIVLVGPRGSGKSDVLRRLFERASGPRALVQLEPLTTTPVMLASDLRRLAAPLLDRTGRSNLAPFASLVDALGRRPPDSLLLFDDVTELRTLSHYPDVDAPLESFLKGLAASGRAVATSRFAFWLRREHPSLELRPVPPVTVDELSAFDIRETPELVAATAGLAHHVVRVAETMLERGGGLASALEVELAPGGRVEAECRATLAELLLRARGYAACKAVLRILADEQGLKLTDVARRMDRTAGSTRDYLRWLEEVDLIRAVEKRFFYVDPILRLWCRVYGRGVPPEREDLRREIAAHLGQSPIEEGEAQAATEMATSTTRVSDDGGYTLPPPPTEDLVEID